MSVHQRQARANAQFSASLHPVLERIYLARGIGADAQLRLDLADLLPPAQLLHIDRACELLLDMLEQRAPILIVGDFDADGATSAALAVSGLRAMGFALVDHLVPNRFEYGYGLSPEIVEVAARRVPKLIVTVDNGISSHAGIARAHELGIKVLVTDHHLPGTTLPEADCILNPNQPGCPFPSKALAGVGVMFYLLVALRGYLRERGWFGQQGIAEPKLADFLDLVALGTVADVVPLDQNNRRLVRHGLHLIRAGRCRPGVRALLDAGKRNPAHAVASDLGFAAGPRLNAAGRLDDMSLGIACLLAPDERSAQHLAQQLDALNQDRRQIEQEMQSEALTLLDADLAGLQERRSICLFDPKWHQGVIGILASRLKERLHRPVIVFARADNGELKGSGRSIQGVHLRDLLDRVATSQPGLLDKFGGHAMAAGLTLAPDKFAPFCAALEATLRAEVEEEVFALRRYCDGALTPDCFSLDFAELLREAGPWGQQFPEPVFQGEFKVLSRRVLHDKHLKLTLRVPDSDALVEAIAFNQDPALLADPREDVNLLYRLDVNEFRGQRHLQLNIDHLEYSDSPSV
ncbi:MAG: single-stranded-DNA-specific exonuclease RecJ [Pseudomonadales bacterium]|nr:single-stranded-DNA-specific exonuclease RecJ [Pseudomonadales bacterium]